MKDSLVWEAYQASENYFSAIRYNRQGLSKESIIACGLTAIASEAALRDVAIPTKQNDVQVITCPTRLIRSGILESPKPSKMLACSYSGSSSEVLDTISLLKKEGIDCDLLSRKKINADIHIPDSLSQIKFHEVIYCAAIPRLLGVKCKPHLVSVGKLDVFLKEVIESGLIPLFIVEDFDFEMKVVYSLWVELIQLVGFKVGYPDFTHNLMWAWAREESNRFVFIAMKPKCELSDSRFGKFVKLIEDKGAKIFLFDRDYEVRGRDNIGFFLSIYSLFYDLACELGRNTTEVVHFDNWRNFLKKDVL